MNRFDRILLDHYARYPLMELQDALKLAYQNAFGPGHMMRNPKEAEKAFLREWAGCTTNADPLYVPVGNGLCRASLYACREKGLPAPAVFELFRSACAQREGEGILGENLLILQDLCEQELLPFDPVQVHILSAKGIRQPHHSKRYLEQYAPSYRLVMQHAFRELLRQAD